MDGAARSTFVSGFKNLPIRYEAYDWPKEPNACFLLHALVKVCIALEIVTGNVQVSGRLT